MTITVNGIDELQALLGQTVGPSEWRTVTQEMIDTFAEISGDNQWIHVDVERAKTESPFGTTIAHGNLTLSLIDGFRKDLVQSTGFRLGVNYGWNKVRFPAPVPAGSRIRARVTLDALKESADHVEIAWGVTIEIEDGAKPALVAEWLIRKYFSGHQDHTGPHAHIQGCRRLRREPRHRTCHRRVDRP